MKVVGAFAFIVSRIKYMDTVITEEIIISKNESRLIKSPVCVSPTNNF
jgi:hypothetical protein